MASKDYYTPEEAARLSPASYRVFEELLNAVEVPETFEGGQRLVPVETFNALIMGRLKAAKARETAEDLVEDAPCC